MHILLLILKILSIFILSVLGLVLLILLIVMLAPIRYSANLEAGSDKQSTIKLDGLVSWLLFIKADVTLREGNFKLKLTAFKRVLFSIGYDDETENDETVGQTGETEMQPDEKDEATSDLSNGDGQADTLLHSVEKDEATSDLSNGDGQADTLLNSVEKDKATSDKTGASASIKKEKAEASDKQPGFFERLYQRLCGIYNKFEELYKIFESGKKDVDLFLKRKSTKYTLELLKTTLIKLGNHSKPRRLSGKLTFGMDDPAATGYVCAAISMFYGDYCDNLDITPDFTEKKLEGRADVRGRLILGYILALALNMYLKKQVRYCIKNVGALKTSTMDRLSDAKDTLMESN